MLHKEEPNQKTHNLRQQVSLFLELKKLLVSMLITLKCISSHRSKGRLFACSPQSPYEHPGSDFTSQTRKTRNLPMQRKSQMRKIAVLLDAQNFEMASLAFQQSKIQYSTMKPPLLQRSSLCHHYF